jgi:hypothetical protein
MKLWSSKNCTCTNTSESEGITCTVEVYRRTCYLLEEKGVTRELQLGVITILKERVRAARVHPAWSAVPEYRHTIF